MENFIFCAVQCPNAIYFEVKPSTICHSDQRDITELRNNEVWNVSNYGLLVSAHNFGNPCNLQMAVAHK